MRDPREMIEQLIYRDVQGRGFTQHSPVLPDVWIEYAVNVGRLEHGHTDDSLDLLLIPNWNSSGDALANLLEHRLLGDLDPDSDEAADLSQKARIAFTQSTVAATLSFPELIQVALPLSKWFQHYLFEEGKRTDPLAERFRDPEVEKAIVDGLRGAPFEGRPAWITGALVWLARVVGTIQLLAKQRTLGPPDKLPDNPQDITEAFLVLVRGVNIPSTEQEPLWSVNLNRKAFAAMHESTLTVKADAARRVFEVTGKGIRWAVLDSGIDARHPAFCRRDWQGKPWMGNTQEDCFARKTNLNASDPRAWTNNTRILETYDFTDLRDLMSLTPRTLKRLLKSPVKPDYLKKVEARGSLELLRRAVDNKLPPQGDGSNDGAAQSRAMDWQLWGPVLAVPHIGKVAEADVYVPPVHKHGTHVAGILAADWRPDDLAHDDLADDRDLPQRQRMRTGVCPEIELYDIRVLDDQGSGDEFGMVAALQFVRSINARHDHVEIHGVNLSFSLHHRVSNYACGRTPICNECDRTTAAGIVVVAAAGNEGRAQYLTSQGHIEEGYRTTSITDPGNAATVITVGATHRSEPHTYGVSYFSSRGPTGDGRVKPDLVAPGEKIKSTMPDGREDWLDGTSMAAPHVSGASALLMTRYPELIGKPAEVKQILCKTATDLGRDRYFQGAGLLDILRALESV